MSNWVRNLVYLMVPHTVFCQKDRKLPNIIDHAFNGSNFVDFNKLAHTGQYPRSVKTPQNTLFQC